MKKKAIGILVIVLVLLLSACGGTKKELEITADYNSVQEAIEAQRAGADVVGKTIKVVLKKDNAAGVIYAEPDTKIKANICVTIITDDFNRSEVLSLKKDDTVVITVDSYDDHLTYSIYIYAKEYQIYR